MAEVEDELGVSGDGDWDFGGEELGGIEGDKAIDTDIIGGFAQGEDEGMECECLASEAVDAV
jgi:hypothetical protein